MKHTSAQVVAIVGPTAVGKTALSLTLARHVGGEIVSADSRQIYRQMDIGTAKPIAEERAVVRHHLIDIANPDDDYSLALYQRDAYAAIQDCFGRGKTPLLVGGTGQYLAAVLQGWNIPEVAPQPQFRAELEQFAAQHGHDALHARLLAADPHAAASIAPTNVRRVIRALEVYEFTGTPISAQQTMTSPPFAVTTIWLTLPSDVLYGRIDARVDGMMEAGLLDEVAALVEAGYGWQLSSMSSLGYREFQPFFSGESALAECVQRLKYNTHAFARRQAAWFRRLPNTTKLHAADSAKHALALLTRD